MVTVHGNLGELLVVIYLAVAIFSAVLANRGGLPAWLTGMAHAILTLQIILGIILFVQNPDAVPWHHVVFGLLTIPALGLIFPLARRLGRPRATLIGALLVAVFAALAVFTGLTR